MTKIIQRHDTAANWSTINPVLALGEMGVETDTNKFKFGNGTTPYNELPYAAGEGGGTGGSGTILTSLDGTTSYDKLAIGNGLVVDTGDIAWTNPQMSSNSQNGYVASASISSSASGSEIWKAFDKDTTTAENAYYTGAVSLPQWIMLECPEPVRLTSCMIMNEITTPANLRNGYIQGSNDGSNFDTLYTITDRPNTAGLQVTYTFDNNKYYKYLRVYFTEQWSESYGDGISIQEIEFSGYVKSEGAVSTLNANLETKQDILVDGNGTKVVDNKVNINQGEAGIQGLNLYQNNGTITKDNDLNITLNKGACGYIFLENKGVNNDYEIILHQSYLGTHGTASDSDINGVRCLPQAVVPTPGQGGQGECWFDVFSSPFRVVAIPNNGQVQQRIVDTINYVKYVIKGTNLTVSYSSTGETYSELYTIAISSTYVINVCIANSPWQNDIAKKWTNTTLYSDSYILDKTTNTYLMKKEITTEGVAIASSTKYGLVRPDNSTIVSNNGVISSTVTSTSVGMPSGNYEDLTLQPSGSSYIAPDNGYFAIKTKVIDKIGSYLSWVEHSSGGRVLCSSYQYSNGGAFIPCAKGQSITFYYEGSVTVEQIRFIYAI